MRIDGSGEKKLADIPAPDWLSFTPDGRHVICTSYASAVPSTWRIPVDGSQAVEIARQLDRAVVSPDGQWLAGVYSASVNTEAMTVVAAVVPLDGHAPLRQLPRMNTASGTGVLTWAKDGTGLIASTNERFNLFFYPISGEPPRPLTKLQDDIFVRGSLSPDGKHIIASRGKMLRDTFTIRGFK
jgi:Tol biopolymer transport system component